MPEGRKLSEEEAEKKREELRDLYQSTEMEKKSLYIAYISEAVESYIFFMDLLTIGTDGKKGILTRLVEEDRLPNSLDFSGRVKSFQSSIINDSKDNKALDDVFAVKINIPTLEHAKIIVQELLSNSRFALQRAKFTGAPKGDDDDAMLKLCEGITEEFTNPEKPEDKGKYVYKEREDGYTAIQLMLYDRTNPNAPLIEVMIRTCEMEHICTEGDLAHDVYKPETSPDAILKMLTSGELPPLPMRAFKWRYGDEEVRQVKRYKRYDKNVLS